LSDDYYRSLILPLQTITWIRSTVDARKRPVLVRFSPQLLDRTSDEFDTASFDTRFFDII